MLLIYDNSAHIWGLRLPERERTSERASAFAGSKKWPHGCAADNSAATVWCFYATKDQNSWERLPGNVNPMPRRITSAGNEKKKKRVIKQGVAEAQNGPGLRSWLLAVTDVMWTHSWCPWVLLPCFWSWSCLPCSLIFFRMRINEEATDRMTRTVSYGASASPLCGTTAVRWDPWEGAWCGREVSSSPAGTLRAARCSNADGKERAHRGHLFMQQFSCCPENDLQEILVEMRVWLVILFC